MKQSSVDQAARATGIDLGVTMSPQRALDGSEKEIEQRGYSLDTFAAVVALTVNMLDAPEEWIPAHPRKVLAEPWEPRNARPL